MSLLPWRHDRKVGSKDELDLEDLVLKLVDLKRGVVISDDISYSDLVHAERDSSVCLSKDWAAHFS